MKAALYARGSDDSIDLANQLGPLHRLCEAREWEPVEYVETETGDDERARRPIFERMLEDARRGDVRVIVVVGLDRLTRRALRLLEVFERAERWNVRIVSLRERESWTDMDAGLRRFVLHAIGMVAEWELLNLRDRTKKGMAKARERGTRSGKPIGRPRANQLLLGAGARHRQEGQSLRQAAKAAGVSEASLRRYCKALAGPRNDEGPGAAPSGHPKPSARQKPPAGAAAGRRTKSTG